MCSSDLLGTRLLVFDKLRHDPQAPEAYGAKVTYDIPLRRAKNKASQAVGALTATAPESAPADGAMAAGTA